MESPHTRAGITRLYVEMYSKHPKKAIARVLYAHHPEIFSSIEDARHSVRRVCGSAGNYHRHKEGGAADQFAKGYEQKVMKFPKGERDPVQPYVVPPNIHKLLVVSDFQVPFHDEAAMEVAFEYGLANNCDAILMNGDQQDFYSISSFNPNPFERRIPEELELMKQILGVIRENFPDIPLYWKDGNHEERWERYMKAHAPALLGVPDFELPVLLEMGKHRIEYVTDKRDIVFGKLHIYHGHEFGRIFGNPVGPARWLSLRAKGCSSLCGHFHQIHEFSNNNVDGSMISWWSSGCLCDLRPKWRPVNDWRHGFVFVERISEKGEFILQNKKMIKYKIR